MSVAFGLVVADNVSVAVPDVPKSEASASLTLTNEPAALAVTSTLTVQLPEAVAVPPRKLIDPSPAQAFTVPPQVVVALGVGATSMPDGNVSRKFKPEAATKAAALLTVKVSVETSPVRIVSGAKTLAKPGTGAAVTVKLAVAVPELPWLVVRSPVVFAARPTVAEVTSTCAVQLLDALTVPPV